MIPVAEVGKWLFPRKEVSYKPGMVNLAYNPRYLGGRDLESQSQDSLVKKVSPYLPLQNPTK
jgi:hypothetical protein